MAIRHALAPQELQQLVKQIAPLKKAFDYLSDHVVITDANANVLYMNRAAEKTTGYSLREALGRNPADMWGGNMPGDFYKNMWHIIKDKQLSFVAEVRNRRKNGEEYWQEMHISPVLDSRGRVRLFIAIEPNITNRKEREVFREEFNSMIGHQLKNPLGVIRWTLELLMEDEHLTKKERQGLEDVYEQNANLLDLIGDLLIISRLEKVNAQHERVDLAAEIDKMIAVVRKLHPGISFVFHRPYPVVAYTNKTLANQIFKNIIVNAAEYSNQKSGKVLVELKNSDGTFVFSCQDHGTGIPKEEQSKIFSRFFRASNVMGVKENGSGLGLFICKIIADQLGWKISFESEVNKGTTFFVEILPGNE